MQISPVMTDRISHITREALPKLKPTPTERAAMERFSDRLLKAAMAAAKPYSAKPMLCGSVAKNTWLASKNELDMFLLFNHAVPRKQLEERGMTLAKGIMEEIQRQGQDSICRASVSDGYGS